MPPTFAILLQMYNVGKFKGIVEGDAILCYVSLQRKMLSYAICYPMLCHVSYPMLSMDN